MATIEEYLTEAERQRALLQEKLQNKGVSALGKPTYNTLVAKVDDILQKDGVTFGNWTPTKNEEKFTISNIPFLPAKISICCDTVLNNKITAAKPIVYIGVLNAELNDTTVETINNGTNTTVFVSEIPVEITVEGIDGLYSVTLSLKEFNKSATRPHYFRASTHKWCVASEEWIKL